jgi:hypothetical protein
MLAALAAADSNILEIWGKSFFGGIFMKAHKQKRSLSHSATLVSAIALTVSFGNLTAAYATDYNSVCGGTQAASGQKGSYCAAAKSSQDASKKDKTMSLIYGAVAGTCAASCAGWLTTAYICEGASLGAAAADMMITKNFASAMMSAGSTAAKILLTQGAEKDSTTSKFSCWLTAATSAMNAVTHGMSASSEQKTADSNLNAAKNYTDIAGTALPLGDPSLMTAPASTVTTASTSSTATTSNGTTASRTTSASCGDTSSVSGAASCAATADPQVASLISSPEFQKAFEKSSGMKLDDYLKNGGSLSGSDAIKAAAGAAMGGDDGAAKLTNAIAVVEQAQPNFNTEAPASYIAGGHGGSGSASGDAEFSNMMNGLMSKLMPKTDDPKKSGISEVKFSGAARNIASVTPEDTTVSLFDRVAYRYSHVTPRLLSEPAQRTLSDWSATSPSTAAATKRN